MKQWLAISLVLTGCASHKQRITATPVVMVPRECIVSVELTPDSECYVDKEGHPKLCRHINLVTAKGCNVLKVPDKEAK